MNVQELPRAADVRTPSASNVDECCAHALGIRGVGDVVDHQRVA